MITRRSSFFFIASAKINWTLSVRGRREDGYHDLDTVFQELSWGDHLVCRRIESHACRIECADPAVPLDESNLIARAWRLAADVFGDRAGGMEVSLDKRIPLGAGLGGGSSNAVAALCGLRYLYDLPLDDAGMEALAARLGSDCAFFVRGGAQRGEGRGERLTPVKTAMPVLHLVIVHPGFSSLTPEAYRLITPDMWEDGSSTERMVSALEAGDARRVMSLRSNVFDAPVRATRPEYDAMRDDMLAQGLLDPLLCGSGAAMFAIARNAGHARAAVEALSGRWPFAEPVMTGRPSPLS